MTREQAQEIADRANSYSDEEINAIMGKGKGKENE